MQSERNRRIGIAVFKVITKHSIKMVPVVGPYLEFSFDLFDEVSKELKSGSATDLAQANMTPSRVAEYLREVSPAEARAVVDFELDTPEARTCTKSLTELQRMELRKRLVLIPFEADRILSEIEARKIEGGGSRGAGGRAPARGEDYAFKRS